MEPVNHSARGSVIERLRDHLEREAHGRSIRSAVAGERFCAVALDGGAVGLANVSPDGCGQPRPGLGRHLPSPGTPAIESLAALLVPETAAIGLATANALANRSVSQGGRWDLATLSGDILEALDLRPDDHLGMVGNFEPLVDAVRRRVARLSVFERAPRLAPGLLPESRIPEIFPECSVALITATTLIGGSLDAILDSASHCREVALLGPSTPLAPEAFAGRLRVTLLSGVVVTDAERLLQCVAEGGGTRQFQPSVAKVNVRVARERVAVGSVGR